MRDVEIERRLRAPLLDPLLGVKARLNVTYDIAIKRNYQPTQQGRPDGPAVFFFKVTDRRVGQRQISEAQDPTTLTMTRTERQVVETIYQFGALVPEYPEDDPDIPLAADVLKAAAATLQAPDFIFSLKQANAGIQRITDIRTTQVENDRGQFEANPTFDVTISHVDEFITIVPATSVLGVNIKRV